MSIIERFRGEHGQRHLRDALSRQTLLLGLDGVVDELSRCAAVVHHPIGSELIRQDECDNDIVFIISGRVAIVINKRQINSRAAGQHVGEMALIDPSARRSASVFALEETVVARANEPTFVDIADRHPALWRRLAIELADRLRQRTAGIHLPNEIPCTFIGSSTEALPVARALEAGLSDRTTDVKIWDAGIFQASETTIESLENAVRRSDFGILVLAGDDYVESRDVRHSAPRDNVVFELGLFMGALGRARTYVASPHGGRIKRPSDLLGMNVLSYYPGDDARFQSSIDEACNAIRKRVDTLGPK